MAYTQRIAQFAAQAEIDRVAMRLVASAGIGVADAYQEAFGIKPAVRPVIDYRNREFTGTMGKRNQAGGSEAASSPKNTRAGGPQAQLELFGNR